jgi:hypothetical protein
MVLAHIEGLVISNMLIWNTLSVSMAFNKWAQTPLKFFRFLVEKLRCFKPSLLRLKISICTRVNNFSNYATERLTCMKVIMLSWHDNVIIIIWRDIIKISLVQYLCVVQYFKGIVSRDFMVCFLVSFDRSDISTHQEWVLLLLKVKLVFVSNFSIFVSGRGEPRKENVA